MSFVPDDLDGSSWRSIEPYMNDLRDRKLSCSTCLETFIADRSSLSEIISEARARLYIDMTCHTDDEEIQKEYMTAFNNVLHSHQKLKDDYELAGFNENSYNLMANYDNAFNSFESEFEI